MCALLDASELPWNRRRPAERASQFCGSIETATLAALHGALARLQACVTALLQLSVPQWLVARQYQGSYVGRSAARRAALCRASFGTGLLYQSGLAAVAHVGAQVAAQNSAAAAALPYLHTPRWRRCDVTRLLSSGMAGTSCGETAASGGPVQGAAAVRCAHWTGARCRATAARSTALVARLQAVEAQAFRLVCALFLHGAAALAATQG